MAFDLNRVIQATVDSVLEGQGSGSQAQKGAEKQQRHGLTVPRAFLIGAGVVTAGRLVAGSRGRDMLENLQQRLVEYEHQHFDGNDEYDDEGEEDEDFGDEPEAEEDEDFGDEPEAEEDEDFGDEPEAEEDEDFDDEPEAEEDEDFGDEPEAEEDEDFDDEPEAEEDEDYADEPIAEEDEESEDDYEEDEEPEEERPRRRARSGSGGRRVRR